MKKWEFRNDMLLHYINGSSIRTFQDAEDRLNFLEEKLSNVVEELKNLKNDMMEISFNKYIQEIIDNLENN